MSLKIQTRDLTSYDFLKTYAVILMIVDHMGYYFFPEENWMRVAGRLCVPVWFFLIGYAKSRDLPWQMWAGTVVLVIGNVFAGMSLIPLSIMATMIFVRLTIDHVMKIALSNAAALWSLSLCLLILIIPTSAAFEYGTQSLVMAMVGYFARHRGEIADGEKKLQQFTFFAAVSFIIFQTFFFGFNEDQFFVLGLGTFAILSLLYYFRPVVYPTLTAKMPAPFPAFFRFCGRRSLEIYVGHLLLFKGLGVLLDPERFEFLDWKLFSPTGT